MIRLNITLQNLSPKRITNSWNPLQNLVKIEKWNFLIYLLENYIEKLAEINLLPELMKPLQLKQKTKRNQDKDNHFDITTLSTHPFNRGKKSVTHSVEKETSTTDHALSNCVFDLVDQSISPISPATIKCKNKMQKMQIFQITPLKLLPTTMTFTLWNMWRNLVIDTENWSS